MEVSTVGYQIYPLKVSPSFTLAPSYNVKHFVYCRHNSSLVCETLLTLILLIFLTWAQKIPCLGFGGHIVWGSAEIKGTSCHWLELLIVSAFHLDLFSHFPILWTFTSFSLNFQDVLWNGILAVWQRRLTARVLNLPVTKGNLFTMKYKRLCLMVALEPVGGHINQHAGKQVYTTHSL